MWMNKGAEHKNTNVGCRVIMLKEIDDVARSLPRRWKGGEAKGGWECIVTFAGDLFLLLVISMNRNTKKKLRRTSFLEDGHDGLLPFHPRHSLSVPLWRRRCHVVMGRLGWLLSECGTFWAEAWLKIEVFFSASRLDHEAHVLTLLPRSVFQVFSSCRRGGRKREERQYIQVT